MTARASQWGIWSNATVATLAVALIAFSAAASSEKPSVAVSEGSLAELVPAYAAESTVSFGSRSPAAGIYETVGWYPREFDFVWSRGERQHLIVMSPPGLIGSACEIDLVLEVGGFVPDPSAGPRELHVSTAGSSSRAELDAGRTTHRHSMAFRSLPEAIAVEATVDALNPRDFGSTDGRSLGWRLYNVSITGLSDCEGEPGA